MCPRQLKWDDPLLGVRRPHCSDNDNHNDHNNDRKKEKECLSGSSWPQTISALRDILSPSENRTEIEDRIFSGKIKRTMNICVYLTLITLLYDSSICYSTCSTVLVSSSYNLVSIIHE